MKRIRLFQYALVSLMVIVGLAAVAPHAGALPSNKKMFVSGDNEFFIYAKGGEKITANFIRSDQREPGGIPPEDIAVMLEGPDLQPQRCTLLKAVAIGEGCGFSNLLAPKTGVYKLSFKLPDTARLYAEVSPNVRWGGNLFSWNIAVADETGVKTGRIWSELYAVRQPEPAEFAADFTYYYMSENGFLYKASYKGYNGQISMLSADAVGMRVGDKCESAYRSIEVSDPNTSPSLGACGGSYKLFFEQPAGDLPQSAKRWDGKDEWVSPSISRPVVGDLRFEGDKNGDTQSGKIKFTLKNFVGQYKVKVDVNDDGNYDATEDIKFARAMKKLDGGTQEITFNGIDGDGKAIPASQRIGIKIQIEKLAEIHLVNADVEGRTGGVEIARLNGDNAPTTRMCWDDTELPALANTALMTKVLDGRNCPDSTGGAHGWAYATGGWGDARYIDDWAYALARVDGTAQVYYPENEAAVVAKQNGMNQGIIATIVGAVIVIGVVAFIVIMTIRRNRHLRLLKEAEQQHTPIDYPGPGDPRPPQL